MTKLPATGKAGPLPGPATDSAGWLAFAAAPTFALMAGISAVGAPSITCSAATLVPINDMALMYLLMSLFHLSPWLKLLATGSRHPIKPNEGE